jgi:hypothetical protein
LLSAFATSITLHVDGVKHPNKNHKPMFLKELSKIWATFKLGEYGPSSYLLVDNSPHKALEYHIIVCFILLGLKHSATSTSLFFMFLTIQVVV